MGVGVSHYIEDPLVAFGLCLLYGWAVVSLTHSPFGLKKKNVVFPVTRPAVLQTPYSKVFKADVGKKIICIPTDCFSERK